MNTTVKESTKIIIALIESGKKQWEIKEMGYSFATVRYWWLKLKEPEKFAKMQERQRERMNLNWAKNKAKRIEQEIEESEKELSTK